MKPPRLPTTIPKTQCKIDAEFEEAIRTGGVEEATIVLEKNQTCLVSVVIKVTGERLYLATRRAPSRPRVFKRMESALATLHRMTAHKRFIVVMR